MVDGEGKLTDKNLDDYLMELSEKLPLQVAVDSLLLRASTYWIACMPESDLSGYEFIFLLLDYQPGQPSRIVAVKRFKDFSKALKWGRVQAARYGFRPVVLYYMPYPPYERSDFIDTLLPGEYEEYKNREERKIRSLLGRTIE